MVATSARPGTFSSTGSDVSSAAHNAGRAAFFAALTCIAAQRTAALDDQASRHQRPPRGEGEISLNRPVTYRSRPTRSRQASMSVKPAAASREATGRLLLADLHHQSPLRAQREWRRGAIRRITVMPSPPSSASRGSNRETSGKRRQNRGGRYGRLAITAFRRRCRPAQEIASQKRDAPGSPRLATFDDASWSAASERPRAPSRVAELRARAQAMAPVPSQCRQRSTPARPSASRSPTRPALPSPDAE